MKNILIINGWHEFAISKGTFNKSLFNSSKAHFSDAKKYKVQTTEINKGYHELTAGYGNGMWTSDGRNPDNPEINYGTGGLLHGKQYILTTSWNAPQGAFTLPDEFFDQISVDNGPLSGFHGMNRYLGIKLHTSIQFHDVEKNADTAKQSADYSQFLKDNF